MLKKITISMGMLLLSLTACSSGPQVATPTAAPTNIVATATVEKPAPVPPPTDELTLLRANPWQWELFGDEKIEQPANYRLTFNTDASLALEADCNKVPGSYQGEGGKLSLELNAATPAACAPESRSRQLIDLLPGATRYTFDGENLVITVAVESGPVTLVFAPAK